MTRKSRVCAVLLLCILLCGAVFPALATEKIAKPDVSYLSSRATVNPGSDAGILLKLACPGFLTVSLQDEAGQQEIDTLFTDLEVPSGEYRLPWIGYLSDGSTPAPGTYMIACVLRDEYGNESKASRQTLTIGGAAPIISGATFLNGENGIWNIVFEVTEPGTANINLYASRDLEVPIENIFENTPHSGGLVALDWNGMILDTDGEGNKDYVNLYPGRYALKVFSTNALELESEPATIYVTVNANGVPFLSNEEGGLTAEQRSATSAQAVPIPASLGGLTATANGPSTPSAEDGAATDEGAGETDMPGDAAGAEGTDDTAPAAGNALVGEAPAASGNVQLGQSVSGVTLVSPQNAQVGAGVTDYVQQPADNYWNLETGSLSDEAVWKALTAPMYVCNIGESDHFYLLQDPNKNGKRIGELHGTNCGVNVLYESEGWALVEAYRNEDGAFMRGWVNKARLKEVTPSQTAGLVLDKRTQTLTLYQDGKQVDTIKVSTGLATEKYPLRETPAGEFLMGTRIGTKEQAGIGNCDNHIRISGGILMHGQPYTKKGGEKTYDWNDKLGAKNTRGTVVVQSTPNAGQTFSMESIWETLPKDMKILILDDKTRGTIPFSE